MRNISAGGLRWTDPNASALSNIIIGAFDALIVVAAVAAFFYFRNPKVKQKRAVALEARNERYKAKRALKLEKREARKNSEVVRKETQPGKYVLWYRGLSEAHIAKRLARIASKMTVLFWELFFIAVFLAVTAIVIAVALHNGSCVGPEGDYSTCYP
jgi:hypothetical protein